MFFVTGNIHKREEANAILGGILEKIDIDLEEIQSTDVEEVVRHKVELAYKKVGKPVCVEDVGLEFEEWNHLPGALIKRFIKEVGTDGLLSMLKPAKTRKAKAICCVAFYDGKELHITKGIVSGSISSYPKGDKSFGWDPIFIPNGYDKTYGELGKEKNQISHRFLARKQMKELLDKKKLS